jgi:hypothetical protein
LITDEYLFTAYSEEKTADLLRWRKIYLKHSDGALYRCRLIIDKVLSKRLGFVVVVPSDVIRKLK